MNNNTYDKIKLIALIIAPILVLIGSIASIWEVANADKITATLAAIDTCIGAIVAILSHQYNKMLDAYDDLEIDYEEGDYYKEHEEFYDTDEEGEV